MAQNGDDCALPPPPAVSADVIREGCFVVLEQHRVDEKLSVLAVSRSKCAHVVLVWSSRLHARLT